MAGAEKRGAGKGKPVAVRPIVPGFDFGPYYIKERIGSGGYGEVFLAVHHVLRRRSALKIIHPHLAGDPDTAELFLREARLVARFDHPNVVSVYDAGRGEDSHLFMAMRFVPGGSLHDLIQSRVPVPELRALRLMRDCCSGLAALHGLGLMHRDIKPANILLEADGRACLTDFGLASFHRERIHGIDDDGMIGGSLLFLAPEQLTGKEIATPRTDLYSLGITFTGLLTGTVPLSDLGDDEAVRRTVAGKLPDPKSLRADLPDDLAALLQEMTAKDPARRPENAGALLVRIEQRLALLEGRRPYLPPSGRADGAQVAEEGDRLRSDPLVKAVLDAYPGPAIVLNRHRQIVAASDGAAAMLGVPDARSLVGQRPGEALDCEDARRGPDGCGTGPACAFCGLGSLLSEVEQGRPTPVQGECRVRRPCAAAGGGGGEFALRLTPVPHGNGGADPYLLVTLRDVSAEKRRRVIERNLIDNLLDTADVVQSLADSSGRAAPAARGPAGRRRVADLLTEASRAMMEEALFQEHLLAAEEGELQPLWEDVDVHAMLMEIGGRLLRHRVSQGRKITLRNPRGLRVRTDRVLLQRAVKNLLRNALEACAPGRTVTVEAVEIRKGGVEVRVHNPEVMTPEVREQVFRRSFSTKAAEGRGVGLHAARLFVETYLGGEIGFTSEAPKGTTFWVRVPPRSPSTKVKTKP
jgi:tRNA A-37 threonylcarbamoyl transferase component Bud32